MILKLILIALLIFFIPSHSYEGYEYETCYKDKHCKTIGQHCYKLIEESRYDPGYVVKCTIYNFSKCLIRKCYAICYDQTHCNLEGRGEKCRNYGLIWKRERQVHVLSRGLPIGWVFWVTILNKFYVFTL